MIDRAVANEHENDRLVPLMRRSRSLRSCSQAQPIHAKSRRERGPESTCSRMDLSGWRFVSMGIFSRERETQEVGIAERT